MSAELKHEQEAPARRLRVEPPSASHADQRADAVIVGAGLGGLSTAIRLLQLGLSVTVIDQSRRVGGLCGTVPHRGLQRVIACNDFGKGVLQDLADMGIEHPFEKTKTRILHRGQEYCLPPDIPTLGRLSKRLPALWRYLKGMKAARLRGFRDVGALDQLMDHNQVDPQTADLLMLPAYLMGVSPDRFRLDALDDEFQHGYGYTTPVTPIGGPQALADALAVRVRALGGRIMLGCTCLEMGSITNVDADKGTASRGSPAKFVHTTAGTLHCDVLVSTLQAPPAKVPQAPPPEAGLPITMLWLTLSTAYRFPKGVHTHVHYPSGIRRWFGDIYAGRLPQDFGFHVFSSDLHHPADRFTANVYFYLPRDLEEDPATQERARTYILKHIDTLLPGIREHILDATLVSPAGFKETHGFEARVTPWITPAGTLKPANYDAGTDTYHAGAAAFPPGDHAGAAIRSSRYVKELVATRQARRKSETA